MSNTPITPTRFSQVLSEQPDIAQLRRQAKELLRATREGDPKATDRLAAIGTPPAPALAHAQLAIAREHGFDSWPRLRRAVAEATGGSDSEFLPTGPVFRSKFRAEHTVFTPKKFLDGATAAGWDSGPLPDAIAFVIHGVYAGVLDADDRFERNTKLAPSNSTMFTMTDEATGDGKRIGVTCLSPGAGAMIGQLEHQVEMDGANHFVILGTAGAISPDTSIGDVIAVTSAVRDDGISQHYLPPDTHVDADAELTTALQNHLALAGVAARFGVTWTVPTPYRSTPEEVEHFAADGVSVVECEVASLLAVAEALGTQASACLAVTSSLVDDEPMRVRPPTPAVLLDAVIDTLRNT